jgi:DNA-directed RNA polymerase subunit RPC12/RpoP
MVLVLKCAACKKKLWRYDKIGPGDVLRCHKDRIIKVYASTKEDDKIKCSCGKDIGIDKGAFIKMISKAFTYSGTKRNK